MVRGRRVVAAEVALVAVTLAVVIGFGRLFDGTSWRVPLVLAALTTHGTSALARRLRVGIGLQLLLVAVAMLLLVNWTMAPGELRFGLPTSSSFAVLGEALDQAITDYPEARAPVEPTDGFVLASMIGVALVGFMASVAAFTLRAPLQALVPPFTLFVLGSLLGSGEQRVGTTVLFLVAALAFVLAVRGVDAAAGTTWLPGDDRRGPDALMRAGAGLVGISAIAAVVVGPVIPGAADEALWSWRGGGGDGTVEVTSPLVTLRSRLVNQSRTVVFTVESPRAAYWRLMALDQFDGEQWTADGSFRPVDGAFGIAVSAAEERTARQQISIKGLQTDYLPAAYAAISVDAEDGGAKWDDRSSTLFVDTPARNGFDYEVVSILPEFSADQLRAADGAPPSTVEDRYLQLPELDPSVAELTAEVTAGATTRYDRALALQTWFRTEFAYSVDVPDGAGEDRLVQFLFEDRAGYCEQFAAAFAAMARQVGIPSRVAVGFTEGDQSRSRPEFFTVRGEDAHAWPELYFAGLGWVPFEPTPGRVSPGSVEWTGLADEDDVPPEDTTPTSTPGSTVPPTLPEFEEPTFEDMGGPGGALTPRDEGFRPHPVLVGAASVLAVVGAWMALVTGIDVLRRRRRRRRAGDDAAARVGVAWTEAVEALTWRGRAPQPTETHLEYATRLASASPSTSPDLGELARISTEARYAGAGPDPERTDRAIALSAAVVRRTITRLPWWRRLLRLGDPRVWRVVRPRPGRQRATILAARSGV